MKQKIYDCGGAGECIGLPFPDNKIIPRNTKQDGTEGSFVGIPSVSQKRKTLEFRSEPFLGREKPFHSKPFSMVEFLSEPFSEEKTSEFHSELFSEEKKLGIPFRTIFGRENT
jgi:hypothetical protein